MKRPGTIPTECGEFNADETFVCTLPPDHDGDHLACAEDGAECDSWAAEPTNGYPNEYTVSVSCSFDATSPEDAVRQMVAWLDDYAYAAGYRVTDGVTSTFVDAEDVV